MFDLTIPEGVKTYLKQTPFPASKVEVLTGGYANFTYRITLCEPRVLEGANSTPIKSLVMKHAEAYIAAWKEIPLPIERQEFEGLAFKLVPQLLGELSVVHFPTLYYEDRENRVILITDNGPDTITLKEALRYGTFPDDLAHSLGAGLGTFIARLHSATRSPALGSPGHTVKSAFEANYKTREIVGSFFFGQIIPTLTETPSLTTPPMLTRETLVKLDDFARKSQGRVRNISDVLNMGDLTTGNLLLTRRGREPRVMVVDWEAARPGFAGMDLGAFLGEMHILHTFHPQSCIKAIVNAFLSSYREISVGAENATEVERYLAEVAADTAGRLGTHLITTTPKLPWGDQGLTRDVVQDGIEYILRSMDRDEKWLRKSLVGGFWG